MEVIGPGAVDTGTKTTIDWLRFRTQGEVPEVLEALRPMYGELARHLELVPLPRGRDGFERAMAVCIGDMPLGRIDFGGASQRGWVRCNVTGKGCEWVQDWEAADGLEGLPKAEIRRLDIALTTWEGEVTHEAVVAAHESGLFCTGGRPPDLQQITSSNLRAGRTCYVGKRDSGKFLRCYEKGFEMAGKMAPLEVTHIDGFPVEDIYRVEAELKAEGQDVPWDAIGRRDQYFAGAYPFLGQLLPGVGCDILMRRPERAPQSELAAALANCRHQYGSALFTALHAYGGDIGRVWDQIVGDRHNQTLLSAGVLLVDHD